MSAVAILAVVFGGVAVISAIDGYFSLERRKIDAALRQQEINDGVPPGTYSRPYKNRKAYRKAQKEFEQMREDMFQNKNFKNDEEIRSELIKGIKNLQQRIDNIDIIMQNRNEKEKENEN